MKTILSAFVVLASFYSAASAQVSDSSILVELRQLQKDGQYDTIIQAYAPRSASYSKYSLLIIGNAFYHESQDDSCIRYMDRVLRMDSNSIGALYYRGCSLYYLGRYEQAIRDFRHAVTIDSNDGQCWQQMGQSYQSLKQDDSALISYLRATHCPDPPDGAFTKIVETYASQGKSDLMLAALYDAQKHVNKDSKYYVNILFNIGLEESLRRNFKAAEPVFVELISRTPDDYSAYAKLVQAHYGLGEYAKANLYRDKLYGAHKKGLLKDDLADMFCFDQFLWKDKRVMAFECYQDTDSRVYAKHRFFVVNADGSREPYVIQTEYDPVLTELKEGKYMLCKQDGEIHSTYNFKFDDAMGNIDYDKLKSDVLAILDDKVQPGAQYRPAKR